MMVPRLVLPQRNDLVMRLIERGADQIVHGGVHDHELPFAVALAIEHARQQHARFGHDGAARLDQDFEVVSGACAGTWPG